MIIIETDENFLIIYAEIVILFRYHYIYIANAPVKE